jgi:hypothetical protein
MKGKTKERWMELCEQAANEQDSEKLIELAKEIDRLLEEKKQRLRTLRSQQTLDHDGGFSEQPTPSNSQN